MAKSIWNYIANNPMGSKQLGTGNVLPGVLTTWSNLLALKGNKTQYDLYKEQAQDYINNARENVKIIKQQGAIALRNLEYRNKLEQGQEVADLGAKSGNMSGSNLDVAIQQDKVRKMNAMTIKGNYTNQAMIAMVNGYRKAGEAYGELRFKAKADKWGVVASILKGVQVYVENSVNDSKIAKELQSTKELVDYKHKAQMDFLDRLYGVTKKDSTSGAVNLDPIHQATYNETNPSVPDSIDLGTFGSAADGLIGGNPSSLSLNNTIDVIPIQ